MTTPRDLSRIPLSQTPGTPLCTSCGHTRASHGQRNTRCWAVRCGCPTGYEGPERRAA